MRLTLRLSMLFLLLLPPGLSAVALDAEVPRPAEGSFEDRAYAAFLGLAYGDALGALTETYSALQIRRVMGRRKTLDEPLPLRRILGLRGRANYQRLRIPGYVTDDTQQTMALLLAVLNQRARDAHPRSAGMSFLLWDGLRGFADILRAGDEAGAWRGTGSSFQGAVAELHLQQRLERVASGFEPGRWRDKFKLWGRSLRKLPYEAGSIDDPRFSGQFSDSNEAAMRTGPLGALDPEKFPEEMLETIIVTSGLLTHADVRAVAMSYAMFKAVRMLAQGVAVEQIRSELPPAVARVETRMLEMKDWRKRARDPHAASRTLREVFHRMTRAHSLEQVSQVVEHLGVPVDFDYRARPNPTASSSNSTLSVTHALALALGDHVSPTEVVEYAVNFGDDSDSVAAMAGSLLGARFGLYWIDDRHMPDRARLWKYAEAFVTGVAPESVDEFVAAEAERTRSEIRFQKDLPKRPPVAACVRLLEGLYRGDPLDERPDLLE